MHDCLREIWTLKTQSRRAVFPIQSLQPVRPVTQTTETQNESQMQPSETEVTLQPTPQPPHELALAAHIAMEASPQKRRSYVWSAVETAHIAEEAPGDVRDAARKWAQKRKEVIGSFTMPRESPADEVITTARCFRCQGCHSGDGSMFRFAGVYQNGAWSLKVARAGTCTGDPKKVRKSLSGDSGTLTVEQRAALFEATEKLLSKGLQPTPGALQIQVGEGFAVERIRAWWRQYKLKHGYSTVAFAESFQDIQKFIETDLCPNTLSIKHLETEPFRYVALLIPLLEKVRELNPEELWPCLALFVVVFVQKRPATV